MMSSVIGNHWHIWS